MKMLMCMIIGGLMATSFAADKEKKGANDPIEKIWKEMLQEKKQYGVMKKEGASAEELKLQETLINELYKTVVAMKKDKYGDDDKKDDKKGSGPIHDAWQKVLVAKKEYMKMEKSGAADDELAEQKKHIEELYKKVIAMKKAGK
jgi:hypothetical protein